MFKTKPGVLAAAMMFAQVGGGGGGGTAPVSPSVLATSMYVVSEPGVGSLELLVLWRGAAGWYMRGGKQSTGGGTSGGGGTADRTRVRTEWISQGGVNLSLRFEPASRRLWILDQEVAVLGANVVMVDGVDSAAGPQVVGTVYIDPAFDTATDLPPGLAVPAAPRRRMDIPPAQTFIRRSPELVRFLQCDARPPASSTYEQQIFDMWCSSVTQP